VSHVDTASPTDHPPESEACYRTSVASRGPIATRSPSYGAPDAVSQGVVGGRHVSRNLLFSVAALALSTGTGFLLAPYLIARVGVAGYGLIPLAYSLANYLSVANIALNAATSRNIVVAATQKRYDDAIRMFTTAFWGSLGIGLLLLAVGSVGAANATALMSVPAGFEVDAQALLCTGTLAVVITLVMAPFSAAVQYANALDVKGRIDITNRAVYAACVIALVGFVSPRPAVVGVALLIGNVVALVQTVRFSRRTMPWLVPTRAFSVRAFADLMSIGGWTVVIYSGNLLLLTVDLILVNRLVGPVEGGIYAALSQWSGVVRTFGTTIAVVFCQTMPRRFAEGGAPALARESVRSMRLMAALLLVPVIAIAANAEPIVRLWLGDARAGYWPLLALLVFHLAFNMATMPLVVALQAMLKVRALALATAGAAVMQVVLAVVLVTVTSAGPYAVAIASGLSFTTLGAIVVPWYACRVLAVQKRMVAMLLAKIFALSVGGAVLGGWGVAVFAASGWTGAMARVAFAAIAACAASWFVLLTGTERAAALQAMAGFRRLPRTAAPSRDVLNEAAQVTVDRESPQDDQW
jgi:O-antigen/teichoic acid export membrane protein